MENDAFLNYFEKIIKEFPIEIHRFAKNMDFNSTYFISLFSV